MNQRMWRGLGISIAQSHNLDELQKQIAEDTPDVILLAGALPEAAQAEIRRNMTKVPLFTAPIPATPANGAAAFRQLPEPAYDQQLRRFQEAMFDALQTTIPADKPVYVSFVTR